jgi:hypothetical protein
MAIKLTQRDLEYLQWWVTTEDENVDFAQSILDILAPHVAAVEALEADVITAIEALDCPNGMAETIRTAVLSEMEIPDWGYVPPDPVAVSDDGNYDLEGGTPSESEGDGSMA